MIIIAAKAFQTQSGTVGGGTPGNRRIDRGSRGSSVDL